MIRAVIVEDEPLARQYLRTLLEETGKVEVVGEADDGRAGLRLCVERTPDAAFLDIGARRPRAGCRRSPGLRWSSSSRAFPVTRSTRFASRRWTTCSSRSSPGPSSNRSAGSGGSSGSGRVLRRVVRGRGGIASSSRTRARGTSSSSPWRHRRGGCAGARRHLDPHRDRDSRPISRWRHSPSGSGGPASCRSPRRDRQHDRRDGDHPGRRPAPRTLQPGQRPARWPSRAGAALELADYLRSGRPG